MMLPRCRRCLSIALVCTCLAQDVKAPPAPVVSWIVSSVWTAPSSSPAVTTMTVPNTVIGKFYDVAPVRKPLYGEHDTPVVYIWPPPDSTKT